MVFLFSHRATIAVIKIIERKTWLQQSITCFFVMAQTGPGNGTSPPNRHISSPLAIKERKKIKIKVINLQNHADHSKKCLSGMIDQTLTWNMKEIKLKLQ